MMTPKFPGRPRSLEPAVVLAWLVSCRALADSFSFGTGAGRSSQPVTVVLMNTHLETLGVRHRFSPFAAASSTSTRRAARCCHRSNAPGGLTTPWFGLMHVCSVHVSKAALGRTSKGELGKEWPEANDRPDDTASIGQSTRRQAQPPHGMDPRRPAGDRDDAPQHSSLVRHRLHRCQAGRRPRFCHTAPHRRHALEASPPPCGAGAPHHRGRGPTRA